MVSLVQFRAYANIGLGLIPDQKRTDLMVSNCHIVDCPHSGGKKVTDKTIIMDAMEFSVAQVNGATLCFISGKMDDFVHLVARVRQQQKRRVIVISKDTHQQSTLQVDCDINMCWERDVLENSIASFSTIFCFSELDRAQVKLERRKSSSFTGARVQVPCLDDAIRRRNSFEQRVPSD